MPSKAWTIFIEQHEYAINRIEIEIFKVLGIWFINNSVPGSTLSQTRLWDRLWESANILRVIRFSGAYWNLGKFIESLESIFRRREHIQTGNHVQIKETIFRRESISESECFRRETHKVPPGTIWSHSTFWARIWSTYIRWNRLLLVYCSLLNNTLELDWRVA